MIKKTQQKITKFQETGAILMKRRVELNFKIAEIAEHLMISEASVKHLESGSVEMLEKNIYYQGIIINYCKKLELKSGKILEYIEKEIEAMNSENANKIFKIAVKKNKILHTSSLRIFYTTAIIAIIAIFLNSVIKGQGKQTQADVLSNI